MAQLTEDQARALADHYSQAAQALSDFRFQNRPKLDPEEVLALKSLEQKLANQSDDFTASAIQLTLDNLEQAVADIIKVAGDAREAIGRLNDIRHVVTVAANLVALGAAVAAGNPEGILKAAEATKDSLRG